MYKELQARNSTLHQCHIAKYSFYSRNKRNINTDAELELWLSNAGKETFNLRPAPIRRPSSE